MSDGGPASPSPPTGSLAVALQHAQGLLDHSPALAEEQAREILQAAPGHPQASLIAAIAQHRQGRPEAARDALLALASAQPKAAIVFHHLGLAFATLGEPDSAIDALRHAVALKPGLSAAWRSLGDLLTLAEDTAAAAAAYAEQIRTAVNDPQLMAAATALCDGRLDVAERLLKHRLKAHPTDVAAIRMLAETGTRLGRYDDAEKLLVRCLERAPGFIAARHNMAIVLFRQNKAAEALFHIDLLLQADGQDPGYRNLQAACLAMVGDFDHSITVFGKLVEDQPGHTKLWLSYGHALKTAGRQAESLAAYRESIALSPGHGEAWWSLANLKTVRFENADLLAMQKQLARESLTTDDRLHLFYAVGRALEERQAYAESFSHYAEGARLRRSQIHYDPARTTAQLDRAKAVFTESFFAAHDDFGHPAAAPIFIVGLPRSGSTLIEQILSSHSAVEGTMELAEIATLSRQFAPPRENPAQPEYPEALRDITPDRCLALGERYLTRSAIYRKLNRPFFIDKMPNNFAHIGLIQLILPNAKIIDARRHPMATCFSAFKQHFARGQHFSYDLRELGLYYNDYLATMAHFDRVLPGRIHRVHYEDLVADPARIVAALLAYCGLPYEPACLDFHTNPRAVRTASSEQVRKPLFRDSLDHWRNYEPWLAPLRATLHAPPAPPRHAES